MFVRDYIASEIFCDSEIEKILTAFGFQKIKDGEKYINGFTEELINRARDDKKQRLVNSIMGELKYIVEDDYDSMTANYWIDSTHNVFAMTVGDDADRWIEIHYELYDDNEEFLYEIEALNTLDISKESLIQQIKKVANLYFE